MSELVLLYLTMNFDDLTPDLKLEIAKMAYATDRNPSTRLGELMQVVGKQIPEQVHGEGTLRFRLYGVNDNPAKFREYLETARMAHAFHQVSFEFPLHKGETRVTMTVPIVRGDKLRDLLASPDDVLRPELQVYKLVFTDRTQDIMRLLDSGARIMSNRHMMATVYALSMGVWILRTRGNLDQCPPLNGLATRLKETLTFGGDATHALIIGRHLLQNFHSMMSTLGDARTMTPYPSLVKCSVAVFRVMCHTVDPSDIPKMLDTFGPFISSLAVHPDAVEGMMVAWDRMMTHRVPPPKDLGAHMMCMYNKFKTGTAFPVRDAKDVMHLLPEIERIANRSNIGSLSYLMMMLIMFGFDFHNPVPAEVKAVLQAALQRVMSKECDPRNCISLVSKLMRAFLLTEFEENLVRELMATVVVHVMEESLSPAGWKWDMVRKLVVTLTANGDVASKEMFFEITNEMVAHRLGETRGARPVVEALIGMSQNGVRFLPVMKTLAAERLNSGRHLCPVLRSLEWLQLVHLEWAFRDCEIHGEAAVKLADEFQTRDI
jgi:hypothetical protein